MPLHTLVCIIVITALDPVDQSVRVCTDKPSVAIRGVLFKVASRCNLNCNYCYVYQHADQSWRDKPVFVSDETISSFISRVTEYVKSQKLEEFSVIFHGGEPLLYGSKRLTKIADQLREALPNHCRLDLSLQTNGLLLSDEVIDDLVKGQIGVSVSIDGPRHIHDRHRVTHSGGPSFDQTVAAIQRMGNRGREIFNGAIGVIDPEVDPHELFEFVETLNLPRYDLLLPDATHVTPPCGRDKNPDLYVNWLKKAFTVWMESFSHIPIRWFDSLLAAPFGVPSPTDVMGFGSVSLLVVETDGAITDHDVFKIAGEVHVNLGCNVFQHSFEDAVGSSRIQEHAGLLTFEGLSAQCKQCPAVTMCGGGSVMHRYCKTRKYDAPTVYCREMFEILTTAVGAIRENNLSVQTAEGNPVDHFPQLVAAWAKQGRLANAADSSWRNIRFHPSEDCFYSPFANTIKRCADDSAEVQWLRDVLPEAKLLLQSYSPEVVESIGAVVTEICVVETSDPNETGIFSFSDDSAPGVIYISSFASSKPLPAEDIADSIYHEFLHLLLYQYQKEDSILIDNEYPRFPAPWTRGLRPSVGFFHGTFVFAHLVKLWESIAKNATSSALIEKAERNASTFRSQAHLGIETLSRFGITTTSGDAVLSGLRHLLDIKQMFPWPQLT